MTEGKSQQGAAAARATFHLSSTSHHYDPRIDAVRDDLVDLTLASRHFAPHYARPLPMRCAASSAMLRATPDEAAVSVSQLLHGEIFSVLDRRGDWCWGFCAHDHYVGYLRADALAPQLDAAATHIVSAVAAPVFSAAGIKARTVAILPAGSRVHATGSDGAFIATAGGFVHVRHVRAIDEPETDPVAVAMRYLGQPYLWGGRGAGGIDCSGLVQVALDACGIECPRDSDQQRDGVGRTLGADEALERGDIVFFPGHVGLMIDAERMIHANAHWMAVTVEPLADVVARLAPDHAQPVLARKRIAV